MAKIKSEAEQEVFRFIKILIVVVALVFGVYLFTNAFVSKEYDIKKDGQKGEIDSSKIVVGSILNRGSDDYFVLAYKSKDINAPLFSTYYGMYTQKEDSLSIYIVDLDNELNKDYYSDEAKTNISTIADIKLSSPTLLRVKNHKIVKTATNIEDIKSTLGL